MVNDLKFSSVIISRKNLNYYMYTLEEAPLISSSSKCEFNIFSILEKPALPVQWLSLQDDEGPQAVKQNPANEHSKHQHCLVDTLETIQ